jgi:hypothetical protein
MKMRKTRSAILAVGLCILAQSLFHGNTLASCWENKCATRTKWVYSSFLLFDTPQAYIGRSPVAPGGTLQLKVEFLVTYRTSDFDKTICRYEGMPIPPYPKEGWIGIGDDPVFGPEYIMDRFICFQEES